MEEIKIGNKLIGKNRYCFVIAEAGVNHNGELEKALELIDIASNAGADAVKFQTFKAEQVVTDAGEMAEYQKKNIGKIKSQREMLRELELDEAFYPALIEHCKEKNITFLSTPHGGKESVDFLESIGIEAYKIGSGDLTNYLLLKKIALTKKTIILSSGMATIEEIKDAVKFIKKCGNEKIIVLHCTTNYPCPLEEANVRAVLFMKKELGVPIGFSDHTQGDSAAAAAVSFGAVVYERHFTISKTLPGPDHIASDEPEELARKIKLIRDISKVLGNEEKKPTKSEAGIKKNIRKSIVAARDIKKGEIIKEEDLEAKRPGNGVSPIFFEKFIGKMTKKDIKKDEQVLLQDHE